MRNKLEHFLLSVLLGLTILLGLSFWLNTIFSFNIFYKEHWDILSQLQAAKTPISISFYISFAVAIILLALGIYLIYRKKTIKVVPAQTESIQRPINITHTENKEIQNITKPVIDLTQPPRLNLPKNIVQVSEQNNIQKQNSKTSENPYNSVIAEIFSNNGYVIKPNPSISGFIPNLFAIGNNEIIWIGGVDCDEAKMIQSIEKLQSVFQETLEDITININAFILDTLNKYDAKNSSLLIFKTTDELKEFINEHPADKIEESEKESFDSYSEYIDTIIQYIKNI